MSKTRSQIKSLQSWFETHVSDEGKPYLLDPHQSAIVLDNHKNCLVTARAGSGKTRTLVAKIVYLLAHENIKPDEIIVFAFNRKAALEINARLEKITIDGQTLLEDPRAIATTFHSFAYRLVDDGTLSTRLVDETDEEKIITACVNKLVDEYYAEEVKKALEKGRQPKKSPSKNRRAHLINEASDFISFAEQRYFENYGELENLFDKKSKSYIYYRALNGLHNYLDAKHQVNFNRLLLESCEYLKNRKMPYRYIFIDEYQDFSLLFLKLITALRATCPDAKMTTVGDDWQAINGFAGSNVCYFKHFEKYFPEDYVKLFIPNNYRSGPRIVKNANYFMASSFHDYNDCQSKNSIDSHFFIVNSHRIWLTNEERALDIPFSVILAAHAISVISKRHQNKTIKILARNNCLKHGWPLDRFMEFALNRVDDPGRFSSSTIHKSKGLEADIVILLEIDAGVFPKKTPKNNIKYILSDRPEDLLDEEKRLFYVAMTRAKESLYIITDSPPGYLVKKKDAINFLDMLNPDWLEYIRC